MLVFGEGLEPGAPRPQLALEVAEQASECVLLAQRAHVAQQPLVYRAAGHQRQHLPRHPKHLRRVMKLNDMLPYAIMASLIVS